MRSWVELTDNPDSYMLLMDNGPDGLPDPATEIRVPLHRGSRFVVDTQRLWHVVVHTGDAPRYALITSFETGPTLERWVDANLPARVWHREYRCAAPARRAAERRHRWPLSRPVRVPGRGRTTSPRPLFRAQFREKVQRPLGLQFRGISWPR